MNSPQDTLKKLKGFRVTHLNIASTPKHLDELKFLMKNKTVDVLSLNETRLDASISNSEVEILGYTLYKLYLNCDLNCYLLGDNLSVNSSKLYEFNSIKSSRNLLGLLIIMNHIDIRATNRQKNY